MSAQPLTCSRCGAQEGVLHTLGCSMEQCPFCQDFLAQCHCAGWRKRRINKAEKSEVADKWRVPYTSARYLFYHPKITGG